MCKCHNCQYSQASVSLLGVEFCHLSLHCLGVPCAAMGGRVAGNNLRPAKLFCVIKGPSGGWTRGLTLYIDMVCFWAFSAQTDIVYIVVAPGPDGMCRGSVASSCICLAPGASIYTVVGVLCPSSMSPADIDISTPLPVEHTFNPCLQPAGLCEHTSLAGLPAVT